MHSWSSIADYRTAVRTLAGWSAAAAEATAGCVILCCLLCAGGSGGKADAKGKAQKALKAVKKSTFKRERKPRYSVVFHRPKTLKHQRDPKYPRRRCAWLGDYNLVPGPCTCLVYTVSIPHLHDMRGPACQPRWQLTAQRPQGPWRSAGAGCMRACMLPA